MVFAVEPFVTKVNKVLGAYKDTLSGYINTVIHKRVRHLGFFRPKISLRQAGALDQFCIGSNRVVWSFWRRSVPTPPPIWLILLYIYNRKSQIEV